jgi:hypothetical protein
MQHSKQSKISVRPTAHGFAVVDAGGKVLRDGLKTAAIGWMWAANRGLHTGYYKRQPKPQIPADLAGEQLLRPKLIAALDGISYGEALKRIKAGRYGPPIQVNDRDLSVRRRHYEQSVRQREVAIKDSVA